MEQKIPLKDISGNSALVDALYLFNQSEEHLGYCLFEFNAYLVYPLLNDKLVMFYEDGKPVGLVTWAFLSDDKAEQFAEDAYMLEESDYWREDDDQLWGIEFIAPYGHARQIMKAMKQVYQDRYDIPKRSVHWKRLHNGKQGRGTF